MPSQPAVREALAALPPDRFAAFVDAVWTVRGRTVDRDGSTLTVTHDGSERRLYARAAGDDRPVPDDVDLVVSATPPDAEVDREWIGPAELDSLLRFAVPDADRDRITAEYLDLHSGSAPDDGHPDPDEGADDGGTAIQAPVPTSSVADVPNQADSDASDDPTAEPDGRRPTRRTVLLAGGAFVAGIGTAAAGGLGPFGSAGGAPSDPPETTTPEPEPAVAVPGLSRSGVVEPAVLAGAHLDRLEATSFTLSTTRSVHADDGTLMSSLGLVARVDAARQFTAEIGTAGPAGRDVFGDPPARATLYSDGEFQYRRLSSGGETTYDAVPLGAGVNGWFYWANVFPFGGLFYSSNEYYRDLFDAVPVSLTSRAGDGGPPYHLHATAVGVTDPNPQVFATVDDGSPVDDLSLLASVTGAGLVDSLRLSFDGERFSNPATAQVSTDYRDLGETSIERPAWADRADSS